MRDAERPLAPQRDALPRLDARSATRRSLSMRRSVRSCGPVSPALGTSILNVVGQGIHAGLGDVRVPGEIANRVELGAMDFDARASHAERNAPADWPGSYPTSGYACQVPSAVELPDGLSTLEATGENEMRERLDRRSGDVAVGCQVVGRVEQGMGPKTLTGAGSR